MKLVAIVGGVRTPHGSFRGKLARLSAVELGTVAVRGLLPTVPYDPQKIDDIIMGCVLPAGLGQAPARQVGVRSGLSEFAHAVTVNKVCGSGMQALVYGMQAIQLGQAKAVVAGGMESMSNAPLLIRRPGKGQDPTLDHHTDHMLLDGLQDAYQKNIPMGFLAEQLAEKYNFSRNDQDVFAATSLKRARESLKSRHFQQEMVPIVIQTPEGVTEIHDDENLGRVTPEKIAQLKPVFKENGTITAATASGIADGAAALFLMDVEEANAKKIEIRATIRGWTAYSGAPEWFTLAPVHATKKLLKHLNWAVGDVDLWEVNEAFAVVPLAFMRDLGISQDRVNIQGGSCAIGHPIGASGARIVVTLLNALERMDKKRGIATICIGGGEALALAIER